MWYHRYWLLSKWQKPMCSGVRTPNFDLSTWCNFPQRGVGHGHLEVSNSESFCQRPTFTKWSNMASWHVVSPSRSLGNAIKLNPTDLLKVCGWRGSSSWLETRKKKKHDGMHCLAVAPHKRSKHGQMGTVWPANTFLVCVFKPPEQYCEFGSFQIWLKNAEFLDIP